MKFDYIRQRKSHMEYITFDDEKMMVKTICNDNWDGKITETEKPVHEYLQELIEETKQSGTVYP